MVGADERADGVRHDEADEGDRAGQRRRGAGEQHDGDAEDDPVDRRTTPEAAGQVVAEREGVEQPGAAEREDGPDQQERARR